MTAFIPSEDRPSCREFLRTATIGVTAGCGLGRRQNGRRRSNSESSVTVEKRAIVTSGPASHRAFPGLARLHDGTLLVLYREGTNHWKTDDSVVKVTLSSDEGATWSDAQTIHQEPGWGAGAHHGPLQLTDGRILAPAMCVRNVEKGKGHRGPPGKPRTLDFRVFNLVSDNRGLTWKRREIGPKTGWAWHNQYGRLW